MGLPQVNGEFSYNYFINLPETVFPVSLFNSLAPADLFIAQTIGTKQNISVGATLSQLIFNGSYLVGLQSTKAYKKIAELAVNKTENSIKEAVYLTYSGILVLDENLKILDKNIAVTKKNTSDVKEIFKVGLGEEQAADQLEYSLTSLESNKKNLARTRANLLNALKFLIGKPSTEEIVLETSLDEILKIQDKLIDESKFLNWENNIDYKISENSKRTKELLLKYEKSKALPSVAGFLSSSQNAFAQKFDSFTIDWNQTTTAGLKIDIPIFSGFERKYKAQQAKIEIEKATLELNNTKERLTKDAKEHYNSYQNALEQLETAKKLQNLSQKIYKTQQTKYFEGIGSSFDLIQAETQKYQADNAYFQAISEVIQTKIKLESLIGEL
jgi:outer membrane protein